LSNGVSALWDQCSLPDRLLGATGITLSSSVLLYAVGTILLLVDQIHTQAPTGIPVAEGFTFVGAALFVAGLAVAGAAFFTSRPGRRRRLRRAAILVAGAFVADVIADVIRGVELIVHHFPGTFVAVSLIAAVAAAAIVVAAALASAAFPDMVSVARPGYLSDCSVRRR
jgi:MFS family permease